MAKFKLFVSHSSPEEKQPRKSVPVKITAKINLNAKLTSQIPVGKLRELVTKGNQRLVKDIISSGIAKEYNRSGLRIRTGKLFRDATQNFTVRIQLISRQIRIECVWSPRVAYFFAHLFGVVIQITDKQRAFLHASGTLHPRASTQVIRIPKRNFLSFRRTIRERLIKEVFRPKISEEIGKRKDLQEAKKIKEKARAVRTRTRDISPFRARRLGLTRQQARDLGRAETLIQAAEELIESVEQGFQLEVG